MPLFEAYIFVDWGAAGRPYPPAPSPDALWIGEFPPSDNQDDEKYCRTREEATQHVLGRLLHHVEKNRRVLVGFDYPYGYPKGFSAALNPSRHNLPWRMVWIEISSWIEDDEDNRNNRFRVASDLNCIISDGRQGPFWGCPADRAAGHLNTHRPVFPFGAANGTILESLRLCEKMLPGVQEVWGLYGPGRVGSQALTGIPRVNFLRFHPRLQKHSRVWPFETGFTSTPVPPDGPFILHAEIWPGVVEGMAGDMGLPLRDQAQVRAMCLWARGLDERGELGALFDAPAGLDNSQLQGCVEEEGWILGA